MRYFKSIGSCCALSCICFLGQIVAAPPRVTDSKYKLDLVAKEPAIVTPVGMTFDSKGRLLVIESHTHERQDGYKGRKSDRVQMLYDSDGDGRLDKWITFADGFHQAMNVLGRNDGAVYLVERGRILLLKDRDGDGKADSQDLLVELKTEDVYPHNALSGIAAQADGSLLIGLGENHGLPYRLIGADGVAIEEGGGQDGVFRMTAEGKKLERIARGMWNPFSVCVVPDGRIFAVDNDPDSSPPCRLLHVVEGGDYGYLYQYGRAGTHPLQAWNGELPGTLPMVCGTGEAPTAIVAHAGSLWVTSWGDHRIERYRLVPRGASYDATREVVVQGDTDFRPTGMAVAPDGSLYFGDWVLRDYPVHGNGRIWRLTLPAEEAKSPFPRPSQEDLFTWGDTDWAHSAANSDDPFGRASAAWYMARENSGSAVEGSPHRRLCKLQAERFRGKADATSLLRAALQDKSADVRLYAVRWIADDRITELRDDVAKLLEKPPASTRYYLSVLAAIDWLDKEPEMRGTNIADDLLIAELKNETRSPEMHALALRLLRPDVKFLSHKRLRDWMKADYRPLRLEAVRTLQQQNDPRRLTILAEVAGDDGEDEDLRAEAIVGLAADAEGQRELLERLSQSGESEVAREAARVLRLAGLRPAPSETKPAADDLAGWTKLLSKSGDAGSGRRLFFTSNGPRCGVCHKHEGRGGSVGPDLTLIGGSNSREQIVASILQPSREVAPHYQPWTLITDDGKTHIGLRQAQGGDNGIETYIDSAGNEFKLASENVEERAASEKSIMPDGLQGTLTISDLRDLLAFLIAGK